MADLHRALRTETIQNVSVEGVAFGMVKLTYGKDEVAYSIHARPNQWCSAGVQSTDILSLIGFSREACPIFDRECYVKQVGEGFPLQQFADAFGRAKQSLRLADGDLQHCGLGVPTPEGIGYFYGKPSEGHGWHRSRSVGDGHFASRLQSLKQGEDDFFLFRMTFGYFSHTKGWVYHYRPKNPPVSLEIRAATQFLGALHEFAQCPEFDFEPCLWWFLEYEEDEDDGPFGRNTRYAHSWFDAHPEHFSAGLKQLLDAHAALAPFGMSFLPTCSSSPAERAVPATGVSAPGRAVSVPATRAAALPASFDVAVSFAGSERQYAQALAEILRSAGFAVFYDDFYPEHLWGKDLVELFDDIYRRKSRYCVIFVSEHYLNSIWTNQERRSAQAKAVETKGKEYILPIRADDSQLPGLPPTLGYISLKERPIEDIAQLLIRKLRSS